MLRQASISLLPLVKVLKRTDRNVQRSHNVCLLIWAFRR